jgi:hypothetical protein
MSLPDSFYIALCMTVLLVGAIYWVWTQIQFVQRKVNMLENIVYELKTLCSKPPPEVILGSVASVAPAVYPPAPSSVLGEDEDLLHEELHKEITPMEDIPDIPEVTETLLSYPDVPEEEEIIDTSNINNFVKAVEVEETEAPVDLQPGGVGSGSIVSSLDNMNTKELRRLAQQRGIRNAAELRKKELIQAIRALPITAFDA